LAATDDFPNADHHFYRLGLQYYAEGRFGALTAMMPVCGNTLHHAVEMILKGRLAHTLTFKQMSKAPYSHGLPRLWQDFKALFPGEDLTRFDQFIDLLHPFESIRYPNNLLAQGAQITVGFVTENRMGGRDPGRPEPEYRLSITDLDDLMNELVRLCSINPEAYLHPYNDAVEVILRNNVSCQGWFPSRRPTPPGTCGGGSGRESDTRPRCRCGAELVAAGTVRPRRCCSDRYRWRAYGRRERSHAAGRGGRGLCRAKPLTPADTR
jgi:hypothetical protein